MVYVRHKMHTHPNPASQAQVVSTDRPIVCDAELQCGANIMEGGESCAPALGTDDFATGVGVAECEPPLQNRGAGQSSSPPTRDTSKKHLPHNSNTYVSPRWWTPMRTHAAAHRARPRPRSTPHSGRSDPSPVTGPVFRPSRPHAHTPTILITLLDAHTRVRVRTQGLSGVMGNGGGGGVDGGDHRTATGTGRTARSDSGNAERRRAGGQRTRTHTTQTGLK